MGPEVIGIRGQHVRPVIRRRIRIRAIRSRFLDFRNRGVRRLQPAATRHHRGLARRIAHAHQHFVRRRVARRQAPRRVVHPDVPARAPAKGRCRQDLCQNSEHQEKQRGLPNATPASRVFDPDAGRADGAETCGRWRRKTSLPQGDDLHAILDEKQIVKAYSVVVPGCVGGSNQKQTRSRGSFVA